MSSYGEAVFCSSKSVTERREQMLPRAAVRRTCEAGREQPAKPPTSGLMFCDGQASRPCRQHSRQRGDGLEFRKSNLVPYWEFDAPAARRALRRKRRAPVAPGIR